MINRIISDLVKYKSYIVFSAKSSLKAEVNNAYLDWLWWILEPLGYSLIYVFVFQNVFNTSAEYYPIFVFSGNVIWNFFSKSMNSSVQMIRNNQQIIAKVYIPKFILFATEIVVNSFKMVINFGIVLGMLLLYDVPLSYRIIYVVFVILLLEIFTFGLGVICMHVGVFVEDLSYIMGIGLNMLMFLSGTFYTMDTFPAPFNVWMRNCNPVAFLISSFRDVVMYNTDIDVKVYMVWMAISCLVFILGIHLIYKNENNYVKVI